MDLRSQAAEAQTDGQSDAQTLMAEAQAIRCTFTASERRTT
jgi:hypothetical protein